jgi:oligopeptide/dipeptide ABC transporter ATP-binding protein
MTPVLELRNLCVELHGGPRVVDNVSLSVAPGEIVGLVGESGSGKSMTAYASLGLFPTRAARIAAGTVLLEGRDLTRLSAGEWRQVRGARIGMVFQDPASFLDPLLPAGRQVAEALHAHGQHHGAASRVRALLEQVELPASVAARYPHELSGGQKQRVLIAAALAMAPALLIADEPTTALDVSVQAGILDLLRRLRAETGLAVLLITHDLGVVAQTTDRVFVMYAGQIIESGDTAALFRAPRHPYTQGLLASLLDPHERPKKLFSIPGTVPATHAMPAGCRFHPRCPLALPDPCIARPPPLRARADAGADRCWRSNEPVAADAWHAHA